MEDTDTEIVKRLLSDIRRVFRNNEFLSYTSLIDQLLLLEDGPWQTCQRGHQPISSAWLARRLKGLGIASTMVGGHRGFTREALQPVWDIRLRGAPPRRVGQKSFMVRRNKKAYPLLVGETDADDIVRVWCPFCKGFHIHGLTQGLRVDSVEHREAHCHNPGSPFRLTGYYVGRIPNGRNHGS